MLLKSRAEATASNELLASISGGTENDCHPKTPCDHIDDVTGKPRNDISPAYEAFLRWWHDC